MLDGFQAGLSWITILRKRDNFRRAFDGFEPEKIARYTPQEGRAADAGRRHRAQPHEDRGRRRYPRAPGSTSWRRAEASRALLWDFVDGKPKVNTFRSTRQVPAETALSRADVEGACRPRLQVRRADDRLRLHAGGRHGQRPSGDLPPARGAAPSSAQ